ncbi:uncharacterized protein [Littorina saxatilis]|uniref:Apple domain-containing protein n=1 Tax=Littorina saxatilis TaxID=31220 RepID=A0AAN9AZT7_9CAEN
MECVAIFGDQAECLVGSDTSLRDYYAGCLTSVCDNVTSALEPMNNYIREHCVPWLERSCHSDADCPNGINAECFKGKCLCTPGYYYSNGQDVCVDNCPVSDQLSEFLAYPHSYMDVQTVVLPGDNVEDCLDACAASSSCITVGFFFAPKTCYTNSVSPRLDPSNVITNEPDATLYQQRCA